jgi:hypothetical protein
MTDQIYIYSEQNSPRLLYAFNLIFKDLLGFYKINIISGISEFNQIENTPKLSYGVQISEKIPYLASENSLLLMEKGIGVQKPHMLSGELYPCFFGHSDARSLLPFDFPALAFWCCSRYEEYQPFAADNHGRFSAECSFAFQNGFLHLPILNLWAEELRKKLQHHFEMPPKKEYKFIPTYDIDYAWAYKHKAVWRQIAASGRDFLKGNFNDFFERFAVLTGRKDPFHSFDYIRSLHEDQPQKPLFFWLLGDYGEFDKNIDYKTPVFRKLIQNIAADFECGIHPSYQSNSEPGRVSAELNRLEGIIGKKVLNSRQHFLKLNFPQTYQNLIQRGIKEDYSLGYAEELGFRASIATPFNCYDISKEQEMDLRIHPFMLMDVTLNVYQKLGTAAALEKVIPIIEITKKVGGELICIWHNNSFCEKDNWKGWRAVYEKVLKAAQ